MALGVTTAGATLLAPGHVQAAGEGPIIARASIPAWARSPTLLRSAGFTVEDAPDPDVLLWGKLVINAAINPLTALLRVPNGELLNRPTARGLMTSPGARSRRRGSGPGDPPAIPRSGSCR